MNLEDIFVDGFLEQVRKAKWAAEEQRIFAKSLHIHPDRLQAFTLFGLPIIIDSTLEPGEIRLQPATHATEHDSPRQGGDVMSLPMHTELTAQEVRPLVVLLDKLPASWAEADRERWLRAFTASLDMIVTNTAYDGPNLQADCESLQGQRDDLHHELEQARAEIVALKRTQAPGRAEGG